MINNRFDKSKVMIVKFDDMMEDFDGLMNQILKFIEFNPSSELLEDIKKTSIEQKQYSSKHKYNLEKFGLDEYKIKNDCKVIYDNFLN